MILLVLALAARAIDPGRAGVLAPVMPTGWAVPVVAEPRLSLEPLHEATLVAHSERHLPEASLAVPAGLSTVLSVEEQTALSLGIEAALDEAARQVREEVSQSELAGGPSAEHLGWTFPGRGKGGVYVEGVRERVEAGRLTVRLTAYAEPGLFRPQVKRERVVVVDLDDP